MRFFRHGYSAEPEDGYPGGARITAVMVAVGLILLLVSSLGCGDDLSDIMSQRGIEYDLETTAQAAAGQLGGPATAAYAVLKAFDGGYSPYQIAFAINAGLLDGSGEIRELTPAWPAGNELSSLGGVKMPLVASVGAGVSVGTFVADNGDASVGLGNLEQMFGEVEDQQQAGSWLAWVLGATGAGYSVGQITQYLGENPPSPQSAPPAIAGVPVIRDGDGDLVAAELPTDWPYRGRDVLIGLQESGEFDFLVNQWVLVIGLVNAGYTEQQIKVGIGWERIGLCTTPDGQSLTVGLLDKDGAIISPEGESSDSLSPAQVAVADVFTLWPGTGSAAGGTTGGGTGGATGGAPLTGDAAKLASGEKVTLTLTPYIPNPDADEMLEITSHEITLDIEPDPAGSGYNYTIRWSIELLYVEDDYAFDHVRYEKGTTFVCEGEGRTSRSQPLDKFRDLDCHWSRTHYDLAGNPIDEDWWSPPNAPKNKGGYGTLDKELEGDGWLPGLFPAQVNWDTYAGVLED